ncbi:MAG: FAD binding domain-containing protein [Dehalococcoidales bacterium]|nr:FAD binding domain-containing protein [Dehalococcoidales bacterium]
MKKFKHINATSVAEATSALQENAGAKVIGGGTDLLGEMIYWDSPNLPETIVNLKTIPDMEYINEDSSGLKIGALTKIHDIAVSSAVQQNYTALAQAASKVASWQLRNMGTIAGNICQEVRCWYFRTSWNKFYCFRKGGLLCQALIGDHRFQHSIFGGAGGCVAANVSDTATALLALDASIVTSKRTLAIDAFFDGFANTVLDDDEIVTEIQVPAPPAGAKSAFAKASIRKAIDFALANVAVVIAPATGTITSARVALGAVAPTPRLSTDAADALIGNSISESVADSAADAALDGNAALILNKYKVAMTKGLVKRAILS